MATVNDTTERLPLANARPSLSLRVQNLFVWGTWALLFLSALAYVWKYSYDVDSCPPGCR
jgi:hypothetical protein